MTSSGPTATFIRACRQPAGGPAEDGGVSNTTTVSVVDFTPLTPGVTYTVWVVGVNSSGEGPISNKITFTA
jgi:Fibronectin type III domain